MTLWIRRYDRRVGITLIELLIVVAILGILLALSVPAVQSSREASRRTDCQTRMRQIALGIENYHGVYRRLPPGQFFGPYGKEKESRAWSWMAHLLPYVEESPRFRELNIARKSLKEVPSIAKRIALYRCPSDAASNRDASDDRGNLWEMTVGWTNYQAVSGSNWGADASLGRTDIESDWPHLGPNGSRDGWDQGDGIMYRTDYRIRRSKKDVKDGLSNTLMIGENLPAKNIWCSWPYTNNAYGTCAIPLNVEGRGVKYAPQDWRNIVGFRSDHPAGTSFALADGSVRFVSDAVDLSLYRALATIAGGEQAPADWNASFDR